MLSGALTANTLATALSVTGPGVLKWLAQYAMDTTSRTMRLQVIIDGVTVYDATTSACTTADLGQVAVGVANAGGVATYPPHLEQLTFVSSLVVKVASSLSETDKLGLGYVYHTC